MIETWPVTAAVYTIGVLPPPPGTLSFSPSMDSYSFDKRDRLRASILFIGQCVCVCLLSLYLCVCVSLSLLSLSLSESVYLRLSLSLCIFLCFLSACSSICLSLSLHVSLTQCVSVFQSVIISASPCVGIAISLYPRAPPPSVPIAVCLRGAWIRGGGEKKWKEEGKQKQSTFSGYRCRS